MNQPPCAPSCAPESRRACAVCCCCCCPPWGSTSDREHFLPTACSKCDDPLFFFFLLHPTHPAICFPKPPLSSVDFVTYREDNSISCSIGSANGRSEISCGIKLPPECFFIFFLNRFPSVFSSPLVSPFRWLSLPYLSRLARFTLALTLSRSPSPNFSQGLVCSM